MSNNSIINYNPDVLSCLANLSSDEVFTLPEIANQMLDLLPQELFSNPNTTFLDPVCKTGVFLREIAKRLILGLESQIPDLQKRLNHIFTKQLYGIAITELTSLLARRSIYCSKFANSQWSTCTEFATPTGNIKFHHTSHIWREGKCVFCGAAKGIYDRGSLMETHAYEFIHTTKPREVFNVKFDVIIGNPPYQLSDGGNKASAKPIYQFFIKQAKKLDPRYITMIVPARWYAGGKGLDDFREEMLHDTRIRNIVDCFDSADCFPGVDISGGVCYFLWDRDNRGDCRISSVRGKIVSELTRPLLEEGSDTFIRFNEAIKILKKVKSRQEESFNQIVSPRKPFGISTSAGISKTESSNTMVKVFAFPYNGYIDNSLITQNRDWITKYKVCISYAYGERGSFPYLIIGKPFIAEPNSCCTETYLVIGPFDNEQIAKNVISYITTKFFRFLVLLKKNTQHATKLVYSFVPIQNFAKSWTDEELYTKYCLTDKEVAYIESMIREM